MTLSLKQRAETRYLVTITIVQAITVLCLTSHIFLFAQAKHIPFLIFDCKNVTAKPIETVQVYTCVPRLYDPTPKHVYCHVYVMSCSLSVSKAYSLCSLALTNWFSAIFHISLTQICTPHENISSQANKPLTF